MTPNDRLAFASDRDGNWEIYTMHADGTHVRRLTSNPAPDREPAWSYDGRRIVFIRLAAIGDLVGQIVVMDADGSHERTIGYGGNPQWSPDDRLIVFHTYSQGSSGPLFGALNIMNADGSGVRQVATDALDPTWMPDGKALAFGGLNGQGVTNVGTVRLDGGDQKHFVTHDPVYACQPDVSPDGARIAYIAVGNRDVTHLVSAFHLEVVDLAGATTPRALTSAVASEWSPSWSPDGTTIAVERDDDGDPHYASMFGGFDAQPAPAIIVLVAVDGSGERVIARGPYNFADPAYAPRAP